MRAGKNRFGAWQEQKNFFFHILGENYMVYAGAETKGEKQNTKKTPHL